jgi:hypothetical protein
MNHQHLSDDMIYPFDARGVAKRFRHAAIFGALDALMPGETMRFCNDHDPLARCSPRHATATAMRCASNTCSANPAPSSSTSPASKAAHDSRALLVWRRPVSSA